MRSAGPADHGLRAATLASCAAHALVLACLAAGPLILADMPREAEARVEVVFGDNADAPGPPAAAPMAGTATPSAGPSATDASAMPDTMAAAAGSSGGRVGLQVPRPDPGMIEAKADPGNRAPKYPGDAWLAGAQGEVVLRLHIGPDGRVSRAELRRSSGHVSLDQAAMLALAQWRFLPALRDGVPVASYRDQATDFELEGGR